MFWSDMYDILVTRAIYKLSNYGILELTMVNIFVWEIVSLLVCQET